jgi:IclR family transcriptional regulator, KDG regulon repressor
MTVLDASSADRLDTSIGKALALLDAFTDDVPSMGASELARRAGVPKSTAHRLLCFLEGSGYVERAGTSFRLGRRLFELGNHIAYCRPRGLRDVALPYLTDLYERSHQVVHLAVLDGTDVLYLEKLFGHRHVRMPSHVGGRVPATCCGLGKALLAFGDTAAVDAAIAAGLRPRTPYTLASETLFRAELAHIRREGVAYDREEVALGLTCVAAPVRKQGAAVAAVSLAGRSGAFDPTKLATAVRRAAAAIAAEYHP